MANTLVTECAIFPYNPLCHTLLTISLYSQPDSWFLVGKFCHWHQWEKCWACRAAELHFKWNNNNSNYDNNDNKWITIVIFLFHFLLEFWSCAPCQKLGWYEASSWGLQKVLLLFSLCHPRRATDCPARSTHQWHLQQHPGTATEAFGTQQSAQVAVCFF